MKQIKRISLLILAGILGISLTACSSTSKADEQKAFDAFFEKQFTEVMESDFTSQYITLEHPEKYGVDTSKTDINLGERYTKETIAENKKEQDAAWKEFKKFDRKKLTDEQQDTYDIYAFQQHLIQELNDDDYAYYDQAFASISGMHYQLPVFFCDYTPRDEQDVKNLITLVKDVRPYMKSLIDYTREQEKQGLLMIDIDAVKEYCDRILKKGENSAILTAMQKSIDTLKLDASKSDSYKKQLKEAFSSSFLPAYQDVSDLMADLKKGKNNEEGLAKFENGKAYYELLLQQSIGSDKSAKDIKKMMEEKFEAHLETMQTIVMKNPNVLKALLANETQLTEFKSYEEILDTIAESFTEDFPTVKNLSYNIENINDEIASSSGVAAYFNTPALDSTSAKQLRVNPNTGDIDTVETYHTVAHEGYPGHMYQYGYMYENFDNNWRKALANSLSYTEGYAVYAQYYAFKYLEDLDQNMLNAIKENELASYCLIIAADVGIHYEGWSPDEFYDYLNSYGFSLNKEQAEEQYKQLQANPCAFEPYYVGYEEIIALKDKAQKELGDKFSDKEFHEALLESGNAPFSVVERHINTYIEDTK